LTPPHSFGSQDRALQPYSLICCSRERAIVES
jgi:hypothetical protein